MSVSGWLTLELIFRKQIKQMEQQLASFRRLDPRNHKHTQPITITAYSKHPIDWNEVEPQTKEGFRLPQQHCCCKRCRCCGGQ